MVHVVQHMDIRQMSLWQRCIAWFRPGYFVREVDAVVRVTAVAAPLANLPQIVRIYTTQQAGSLSLVSWMLFLLCNIPMLAYGMLHRERIIVTYTSIALCMEVIVIAGILLFA
jgi:uncharacterized protein with PQ loop repeat